MTSTSLFPNYPYDIDAEPTEKWTIEQVLQYHLLQAHRETDAKYADHEVALKQRLEQGKEEIRKCQKQVNESSESKNPQITSLSATKSSGTKAVKNNSHTTIGVEIIAGMYAGTSYRLAPKTRFPCFVGRSQGKKFKERGISLPKDLEISTTHGKFMMEGGGMYYCDVGSTNGSMVGTQVLEPNVPFPLEDGTEVILGQTVLKVTLS